MSILLQQLTKRYDGRPVVNDVSLEIADGEFFVLLGSSGSGKMTVLSMIAGLTGIDEGQVLLHGRDVGEFGAVLVIGGGIQGRTETATLFIYRALDDRQYIGAYSAALVLGLFSLLLVMGTEFLRRRHQH